MRSIEMWATNKKKQYKILQVKKNNYLISYQTTTLIKYSKWKQQINEGLDGFTNYWLMALFFTDCWFLA